ncbi:MAG: hypothetical protein HGA22_00320 [Clostridiales bacterium]|nr:hypothetical protein [Clostridiales bacterium]
MKALSQRLSFKSNKGSSSVLVILIMITLVVFGLLVFMTTYSELKLAHKNGDWVKGYYSLDGKAEALTVKIDKCLKKAIEDSAYSEGDNLKLRRNLYYTYAANCLKEDLGDSVEVINHTEDNVTVSATVTDGTGDDQRSMYIELRLVFDPAGSKETGKRYEVLAWKELPRSFEFVEEPTFD